MSEGVIVLRLLRAQREDGIDFRCAQRRNVAGEDCDCEQHHRDANERDWIGRTDPIQQSRHDACQKKCRA